jgi:hypothetical protein
LGRTPFPALDVDVKVSGGGLPEPGLIGLIGGDFANVLYSFSKTFMNEAIQFTKEEHTVPFVQNRSIPITACAGLIKVF